MPPIPFTNMALSFSGGGYRALTFHLGGLCYLHSKTYSRRTLLRHVKMISTISGGSIVGAMYALFMAKGRNFEECFEKLYILLDRDELVDLALHKLNKPEIWRNHYKTRDTINAFAEVYNEYFFDEATFADLYNYKKSHLTDVILGASEFTYGIQFRFQEEHEDGKFGNGYLNLPKEAVKEIRLADAVAASSCFPGGFEPMVMPVDFSNGPDSLLSKAWYSKSYEKVDYPPTAIMDGGIIDNQGIEGIKLAEKRHSVRNKDKPFIGTFIVSDVMSKMMKPYQVPEFNHQSALNSITIEKINIIAGVIMALIVNTLILVDLSHTWIIVLSFLLPFPVLWFLLFFSLRNLFRKALNNFFGQEMLPELIKDFKVILKTPLYILLYLLKFRVTSVIKIAMDLFLRRIRRLQYDSLYNDHENWSYRVKSNYIYKLWGEKGLSPKMNKILDVANTMPTTLWFPEKEKEKGALDDLIACGQFTMCYNLKLYAERLQNQAHRREKVWDQLTPARQKSIKALQEAMEADWQKFLEDPYWMLNELKEKVLR